MREYLAGWREVTLSHTKDINARTTAFDGIFKTLISILSSCIRLFFAVAFMFINGAMHNPVSGHVSYLLNLMYR